MSKMKEEIIKQREEAYAMGRCDDLYQEHLAEISFCELEARKKAILDCAEWMKNHLDDYVESRMMREYLGVQMIRDLLVSNEIPF